MGRREVYVVGGIEFATRSRAIVVKPADIVTWSRASSARIPSMYFVATAQHETDFAANETDYEAPDEHGHVFVSKGLYQVSDDESRKVGFPGQNLLDPVMATVVFARLAEWNYDHLVGALPPAYAAVFNARPDRWAYLAYAHNEGIGAFAKDGKGALGAICRHGIDWADFERRNPTLPIVAHKYGHDAIDGGPYYPR